VSSAILPRLSFPLWRRSLNRLDSSIRRVASGEGEKDFVIRLYRRMLGRAADVGALSEATENLVLGALRRGQLRTALAASCEHQSLIRRFPLPLRKRWKRLANRLDSSIRRSASRASDEAFVLRLYRETLGRTADEGALSEATENLALGVIRRSHIRRTIAASPEYGALASVRDWLRDAPAPATDRSVASSPPEEVWLELTTRCNMVPACAMCGYAGDDPRAPGRDMDPRTWQPLLPLLREARYVGLHGAGEPLLYPFLGDLLTALHPSPALVGFNSNGHLLTDAVSRRLVKQGLGWISISLDAATAPTYLRIRGRPDFEILLSKIRSLREIRNAAGSLLPQIEINMTLMRLNLPEAPAFVELAASLGLDRVMFQEIQPGGSQRVVAPDGFVFDYGEQELTGDPARDDILEQARERARTLGLQFSSEILYGTTTRHEAPGAPHASGASEASGHPVITSSGPACAEPWRRLLFNVDGSAFICCIQMTNKILLGQAPKDSSERIWNGRKARLVREAMFGTSDPSPCHGCYRTS
jgi:MoaA/NifB/PqqE/SkfB family radical SAM enzyme